MGRLGEMVTPVLVALTPAAAMSARYVAMAAGAETALLTERRVAGDDGLPDTEPAHLVGDHFLGVRQSARELSAQLNPQGAEVRGSRGDVGVVVSRHALPGFSWHGVQGDPSTPLFRHVR